jgi:hypothetical protein
MKALIVLALTAAVALTSSAQTTRSAVGRLERQGVIQMKPLPDAKYYATPSPAAASAKAATPAAAAPTIEADLKPSPITLFGKISGLSGTLFVTNVGAKAVSPFVQLAVVDKSGKMLGWVTNSGAEIQPKESTKIQVLATNSSAVNFKIMRLVGRK